MRICAAADVHYPGEDPAWASRLAAQMCASGADVLVLAGDTAVGEEQHYRTFLGLFEGFAGPKFFVPGNHDLWSVSRRPDTPRRYTRSLRSIAEGHGFHYLPGAPVAVGKTGFVGSAGWYDYGFRQVQSPRPGLRVMPFRVAGGRGVIELPALTPDRGVLWHELTDDHYAHKALAWKEDERLQNVVWNDAVHVDWGEADDAVARRMAADIATDAAKLGEAARLVGVCHFLPFAELLGSEPSEDVANAFCRAYLGSPLLGEALQSDPRFRLVLCGHAHKQQVVPVGELVVANCSVGDRKAGPLLLTLPEGDES